MPVPRQPRNPDGPLVRRGREVAGAGALRKGHISFRLEGSKLHGAYALTRMKGRSSRHEPWLLVKENDRRAATRGTPDPRRARTVRSGRTLKQTAARDSTKRRKR